jgi:pyruvate kinase
MPRKNRPDTDGVWDDSLCRVLIDELAAVRAELIGREGALEPMIGKVSPVYLPSARNLAHYLALRQRDRRPLQEKLARLGVSSLGRAESHVLANLNKASGILHRLGGMPWLPRSEDEPVGIKSSSRLLAQHAADLLGPSPADRAVRIMVTLPSEAATDFGMLRELVESGMDIARINCAHDDQEAWHAMADNVRRAAKAVGRPVRILMDLGGPKLRTGAIAPLPPVLKLRPLRDAYGRVIEPAHVGLRPAGQTSFVPGADSHIGIAEAWLHQLVEGDRIDLIDARGAPRTLFVVRAGEDGVLASCARTAYVTPETRLHRRGKGGRKRATQPVELPVRPGYIHLERGSRLRLTRSGIASPAPARADRSAVQAPLAIACTLPEVFAQVAVGERIWFDDGRIGGVIAAIEADWLEIEITQARAGGEKLAADKGINLPDSRLELPALTGKDIEDLASVVREADLVGLSFVQRAADIDTLRSRLQELGCPDLGILLKIETRRGFENLPELLLAAMAGKAAGVMIARGDLAVECGYERLAEVQEEILWAAEAAHMPVVWATQVLETLAKTGMPSRAEITDAAMGERAECVMLNKGPFIGEAMRTLDDILRRMQDHQSKKRPLLRALLAWGGGPKAAEV